MKVLVVGGSGFIGSHVVDRLLIHGHSVRVFDRQPERFRGPLPKVDYCYADFADRMALVEALTGMDAVYHLLSTTVPGTADLDPKTDVQDNLIGTINLLDSMQRLGLSRILFLSSGGTVYGVPDTIPIPETHLWEQFDEDQKRVVIETLVRLLVQATRDRHQEQTND